MERFCPICMERDIEPTATKCPFCGYSFDTPVIQKKPFMENWKNLFWGVVLHLLVLGSIFFFLTFNFTEPRLTEAQYLDKITADLTVLGQEYSNLNILINQVEQEPALRVQKDWQKRVATTEQRIEKFAQEIGGAPINTIPVRFENLNQAYKVLASISILDAQLKVACYQNVSEASCANLEESKILFQKIFAVIQKESQNLGILVPLNSAEDNIS